MPAKPCPEVPYPHHIDVREIIEKEKRIVFNCICSPDYVTVLIWQQIMKRLIKRYVLKAQVDKENDEVNEGKKETASATFREFLTHCTRNWCYSGAWRFWVKRGFISTSDALNSDRQ